MTAVTSIRVLRHNVVRVTPAPGDEVMIWVSEHGADICVATNDGMEGHRVKLEGPKMGQKITVVRHEDGSYDVEYAEV